jgi:hypothetical protein
MVVGSLWPGRSKGEMKEELARGPHMGDRGTRLI